MLANGWLSTFDNIIKGNASLYTRYMDDILRDNERSLIAQKLNEINFLHPTLKFTVETETDGAIAFLDMKVIQINNFLSSTCYTKSTDTGLLMNHHTFSKYETRKIFQPHKIIK